MSAPINWTIWAVSTRYSKQYSHLFAVDSYASIELDKISRGRRSNWHRKTNRELGTVRDLPVWWYKTNAFHHAADSFSVSCAGQQEFRQRSHRFASDFRRTGWTQRYWSDRQQYYGDSFVHLSRSEASMQMAGNRFWCKSLMEVEERSIFNWII